MLLLHGLWTVAATLLALTFALLWGALITTPFLLIRRGRRERYTAWAGVLFGHCTLRLAFLARPRVDGIENIPFGSPYLVISNHRSWVDPVLHVAYARAAGLSKSEIAWLPFIGLYAYLSGAVFFDRGSKAARRQALHEVLMLLHGDAAIHVFPEGTRTRDGKIGEKIHLKLVEACWAEGIPVVPAAVMHTEYTMPVRPPVVVPFQTWRARYLPPVRPEDYPDAETFARAAWDRVVREVAALERAEP